MKICRKAIIYFESAPAMSACHHLLKVLWRVTFIFLVWQIQAVFYPLSTTNAQESIGYVLDVKGSWVLNDGSAILSPGSILLAGGVVKTLRGSTLQPGDQIVIVDNNGKVIVRKQCDRLGECSQPIFLPAHDQNNESVIRQIIKATMSVLARESQKFTTLISRGKSLEEGVVSLEAGQVNLSLIFAGLPDGPYYLRFDSTTDNGKPSIGPVGFYWQRNKSSLVKVNSIKPGLYEVKLLDNQDRQPLGPGAEAWVLVVSVPQYAKAAAEYQKVGPVVSQWRGKEDNNDAQVRANAVRRFLRAYLTYLANYLDIK